MKKSILTVAAVLCFVLVNSVAGGSFYAGFTDESFNETTFVNVSHYSSYIAPMAYYSSTRYGSGNTTLKLKYYGWTVFSKTYTIGNDGMLGGQIAYRSFDEIQVYGYVYNASVDVFVYW